MGTYPSDEINNLSCMKSIESAKYNSTLRIYPPRLDQCSINIRNKNKNDPYTVDGKYSSGIYHAKPLRMSNVSWY